MCSPVSMMRLKAFIRSGASASAPSFRASFGIPSGPHALLLFNFFNAFLIVRRLKGLISGLDFPMLGSLAGSLLGGLCLGVKSSW